ncbi:MAG TPA: DUF4296 domain-containing protein [Cryomorphaceae bacterium]|nr:DUF4296 domain-containing protein [Cryomorphaceae bacterium]
MSRFLLALTILLAACSSDAPEKPDGVLSSEKFTALMIDVQLIEGIRAQRIDVSKAEGRAEEFLYAEVFDKHNISRADFEKTYAYYMKNPKSMERIYEQVLDSLNKLDADIKLEFSRKMKAEADSLRNLKDKKRGTSKEFRER